MKKNLKAPSAQANKGGAPEDDKTVYKVPVGDSYWKGEKDAQVTIVEFSDYQCPFCTRAEATVKQALEAYPGKVKVVFKHNPLAYHADAPLASQPALFQPRITLLCELLAWDELDALHRLLQGGRGASK